MVQSLRTLAHDPYRDPRRSEAGVRAARLLCAIFLLQISVSAVTSRSICSSECSGVGVSHRLLGPTRDSRVVDRLDIDTEAQEQLVGDSLAALGVAHQDR